MGHTSTTYVGYMPVPFGFWHGVYSSRWLECSQCDIKSEDNVLPQESMGGAAGTAGTVVAVPLLREVQQNVKLYQYISVIYCC